VTAPVGRDTPMRQAAENARQIDALSKRPVQGVADGQWAYIYLNDDILIPTGDYTRCLSNANGGDTSDDTIFEVDLTGGHIDILVDGIYEAAFAGMWQAVNTVESAAWILWRAGSSFSSSSDVPLISGNNAVSSVSGATDLHDRFFSVSDWQLIPSPRLSESLGASPVRVLPVVYHELGSDRELENCMLLVRRVGNYP
jgi:hypothetical protein